jgi:hypothetical protein
MDTLLSLPSSAEIKNAVPVCFHGVDRVSFTFFPFAGSFLTNRIVSNRWTTRVALRHCLIEFIGNSSCIVTFLAFSLAGTHFSTHTCIILCAMKVIFGFICVEQSTLFCCWPLRMTQV